MSISLALIPLALAVRGIMGKDRFEKMVEASQVKVKTNFKDEKELVGTVRKAGFDAVKWGDSIKTHIDGEKMFFFWELIDGEWTAVFGKYDSKELVSNFIQKIEKTSGRNIFITNFKENTDTVQIKSYPTSFKDEDLLIKTLDDYGVNYSKQYNGIINCSLESHPFKLVPNKDSFYMIEIEKEAFNSEKENATLIQKSKDMVLNDENDTKDDERENKGRIIDF